MHQTFLDVLLQTSVAEFCSDDDDGEGCAGVAQESARAEQGMEIHHPALLLDGSEGF